MHKAHLDRCCAIRLSGKRCNAFTNLRIYPYYGDPQFYDWNTGQKPTPQVVVLLCSMHHKPDPERKRSKT